MKLEDNTFTRKELAELLGVDIVPGKLANAWNSLVVWKQINSPTLTLKHSIERTEHMIRLVQEGQKEEIFRGRDFYKKMPLSLINNASYYEIDSGLASKRSISLDVGINALENKFAVVSEGEKNVVPGFNDRARNKIHQYNALTVFAEYDDQEAMPVLAVTDHGLCVQRPQNREELIGTLNAVGAVMEQIREGQKPDFVALRNHLIENVGLAGFDPDPKEHEYFRKKTERTLEVLGL